MTEAKVLELILTLDHLFLMLGIFAVILTLKWMGPVKKFLFSDKWKWLIAPINILLSGIGIFGLGMTDFETIGMKVIITLILSTVVTFLHESIGQYIIGYLEAKVKKVLNKN